jgi:hypothetical protein
MPQRSHLGLVLASPSVVCAEGYARLDSEASELVEKAFPGQADVITRYRTATLARRIGLPPAKAAVLVGGAEAEQWPFMRHMALAAAEALGVEATVVLEAPHFIDESDNYIQEMIVAARRTM